MEKYKIIIIINIPVDIVVIFALRCNSSWFFKQRCQLDHLEFLSVT